MEDYATATVVHREAPVSSHLGDSAIVRADGRMEGFVGGACSRDIVRRQALAAMHAGAPRLVRIRPGAGQTIDEGETVTVPMTCVSEGSIDVYIEPHVRRRQLIVAGFTPVAHALGEIAPALDFEVVRFVDDPEIEDARENGVALHSLTSLDAYLDECRASACERAAGIAASQGHYDERALFSFARFGLGFTGLLASPRRAAAIRSILLQEGADAARVDAIRSPVGLAIGARKPPQVAVSILAEIVAWVATKTVPHLEEEADAIDPVCGMTVDRAHAQHAIRAPGETVYFCCAQCRAAFVACPDRYSRPAVT